MELTLFAILIVTLVLFIWGRWRYDIVALTALMVATLVGLVPAGDAFAGFGHPAVVTVAAVLVISRALHNSGVVDYLAAMLDSTTKHPLVHIGALTSLGACLSGFMNNVGALALLMPVAMQSAAASGRSPAQLLMPLSFGSILGGMMTLMGTPPNIIISTYRAETLGTPFSVFDFSPVGVTVAAAGIVFITLIGWRLIPAERRGKKAPAELFQINEYIMEARVTEDSELVGKGIKQLTELSDDEVSFVGRRRGEQGLVRDLRRVRWRVGDILIIEGEPESIRKLAETAKLELVGTEDFSTDDLRSEDVDLVEAVVKPGSLLENKTAKRVGLSTRFDVNLLALARQGNPYKQRLDNIQFKAGDVVLLQGRVDALDEALAELGALPLARRGISLRKREAAVPTLTFGAALAATVSGLLPVHVAFASAVCLLVLLETVSLRELYEAVDWPVIVLLGAMIPIGRALETSGGTELIATGLLDVASGLGPVFVLSLVLVVTMTLSDIMNNAATTVVMAPIAATIATQLGVSVDAFLMAVAVGASCAFLTPIGHQNNVLVMGPAGYRFGDYWRMGLPLEVLIVAISVPLIVLVWGL